MTASHAPATWHASFGAHVTPLHSGTPAQAPFTHTSAFVSGLPSSQLVPFGAAGLEHVPVAGAQVPASRQGPAAVHTTPAQSGSPTQVPLTHRSVLVNASPSSQLCVFGAFGLLQSPVAESHWPGRWHASLAVHTTPVQSPTPTQSPP